MKKPSSWVWEEFNRSGTCEVCRHTGSDMNLCKMTAGKYRDKWVGLGCRRRLEKGLSPVQLADLCGSEAA